MPDEHFREPRIVVLGGTGFVGQAFARGWANASARPSRYLLHRSRPRWLNSGETEIQHVDINDAAQVLDALRGHDVLINLLRPDGSGWYRSVVENLRPSFQESGITRCIHASSIDVYSGVEERHVREDTRPQPLAAYEREHLAVESLIRDSFPETIVLRFGAVFGPGGRNLVSLAEEMRHAPSWKIALRRSLYGARRMHLVSVETAAGSLVHLALHRNPLGSQLVLVTDDHDPNNNFAFVQDRLAAAFGRSIQGLGGTAPKSLLKFLLRSRGLPSQSIDRRFSHERAVELGLPSEAFPDRLEKYAVQLAETIGRYGE
ncbi:MULTISPECIES: NAD-dependent epimerase/dehydratase family protein [Mesorhizobium]|uniref:NAD-dependent epimerase/dehydratase family protein n=1 Tax=Mesorhizobium australicum TaxID=536018 RepID=UPI00333A1BF9